MAAQSTMSQNGMDSEVVQPGTMPNTLMQDDVGAEDSDVVKVSMNLLAVNTSSIFYLLYSKLLFFYPFYSVCNIEKPKLFQVVHGISDSLLIGNFSS